ncbi:hypothetical protein [Tabrizicola sp.]|uniref:hypothetical protein n=1 Tax=Tabrizicola sp. TaxID=2005166 RepID=UPI003F3C6F30
MSGPKVVRSRVSDFRASGWKYQALAIFVSVALTVGTTMFDLRNLQSVPMVSTDVSAFALRSVLDYVSFAAVVIWMFYFVDFGMCLGEKARRLARPAPPLRSWIWQAAKEVVLGIIASLALFTVASIAADTIGRLSEASRLNTVLVVAAVGAATQWTVTMFAEKRAETYLARRS